MRVQVVEININVVEGMNLLPKDRNFFGVRTSSDPYVIVRFWLNGKDNNRSDEPPIDVGECEPIMENLNPVWNFECNTITVPVDLLNPSSIFEIIIQDYDRFTSDDYMGSAIVPIGASSSARTVKQWYRVKDDGGKAGEVHCEMNIRQKTGYPAIQVVPRSDDDRGHDSSGSGSSSTMKKNQADRFAPCTQRILDKNHSRRRRDW